MAANGGKSGSTAKRRRKLQVPADEVPRPQKDAPGTASADADSTELDSSNFDAADFASSELASSELDSSELDLSPDELDSPELDLSPDELDSPELDLSPDELDSSELDLSSDVPDAEAAAETSDAVSATPAPSGPPVPVIPPPLMPAALPAAQASAKAALTGSKTAGALPAAAPPATPVPAVPAARRPEEGDSNERSGDEGDGIESFVPARTIKMKRPPLGVLQELGVQVDEEESTETTEVMDQVPSPSPVAPPPPPTFRAPELPDPEPPPASGDAGALTESGAGDESRSTLPPEMTLGAAPDDSPTLPMDLAGLEDLDEDSATRAALDHDDGVGGVEAPRATTEPPEGRRQREPLLAPTPTSRASTGGADSFFEVAPFDITVGASAEENVDLTLLVDWSSQLPGREQPNHQISAQDFMRALVADLKPRAEEAEAKAPQVPIPPLGTDEVPATPTAPAPTPKQGGQEDLEAPEARSPVVEAPGSAPDAAPLVPAIPEERLEEDAILEEVEAEVEAVMPTPPPTPVPGALPPALPVDEVRREAKKAPPKVPPSVEAKSEAPAKPKLTPMAQPVRPEGQPPVWSETLFDEDWLRTNPAKSPAMTEKEVRFIRESLGLRNGDKVLDIACGYGRHALELATFGMQMVGLDLSLPYLMLGADLAEQRGVDVSFVHGDMRQLSYDEEFDAAYCMYDSFGYFEDNLNLEVLRGAARALKPGGRFLLQVTNRDFVVSEVPVRGWWEGIGCMVLEEVDFNPFKSVLITKRSVAFEDGRQTAQRSAIRLYDLHELGRMLGESGFKVTEVSGSLAHRGIFLGSHSRELILLAAKRTDVARRASQAKAPDSAPSSPTGVGTPRSSDVRDLGKGAGWPQDEPITSAQGAAAMDSQELDVQELDGELEDLDEEFTPTIRTSALPRPESVTDEDAAEFLETSELEELDSGEILTAEPDPVDVEAAGPDDAEELPTTVPEEGPDGVPTGVRDKLPDD